MSCVIIILINYFLENEKKHVAVLLTGQGHLIGYAVVLVLHHLSTAVKSSNRVFTEVSSTPVQSYSAGFE